jgi:hypothetical protein
MKESAQEQLKASSDKFHQSLDALSKNALHAKNALNAKLSETRSGSSCTACEYEATRPPPNHNHVAAFSVEHTVSKLMSHSISLTADLEELAEYDENGNFKRGLTHRQVERALALSATESLKMRIKEWDQDLLGIDKNVHHLVQLILDDHRQQKEHEIQDIFREVTECTDAEERRALAMRFCGERFSKGSILALLSEENLANEELDPKDQIR